MIACDAAHCDSDDTILPLIDAWARHAPDQLAVAHGEGQMTYAALIRRADDLARGLRARGVGRDDLVGVLLDRSPELIVALLGVLRAGGAYVPLDPAYPDARLHAMIGDSGARLVLTSRDLAARVAASAPAIYAVDEPHGPAALPCEPPRGGDLAYCIYTSGSTGAPKGVLIEHRSLRRLVESLGPAYGLTPADRALQFTSPSFDISVEEIFTTLAHGATLVLRDEAMTGSYAHFARACRDLRLTVLNLPTAFWHGMVEALTPTLVDALTATVRLVVIGGEAAAPAAVLRWRERVGAKVRLINAYGPTETTVTATIWDATQAPLDPTARSAPIGAPLPHVEARLLDDGLRPAAPGEVGVLYLGGTSLARGYLGRPELTAERFVTLPHGGRFYRTGDLAFAQSDGALVWVGRADQQVKVRGFRIEPGEIEAALQQHPAVAQAAVVAPEVAGGRQLRAFVAPRSGAEPTPDSLRAFLAERLPPHMVPARLSVLPRLPETVTGKVDRAALAALPLDTAAHQPAIPGAAGAVAAIFACALDAQVASESDDFFALGGDSLAAMEVLIGVADRFGIELTFRDLYEQPTVGAFAALIEARLRSPGAGVPELGPTEDGDGPARYSIGDSWLLVRMVNAIGGYMLIPEIVPIMLRLRGPLDPGLLQAAADMVVARHEALRTVHLAPRGLLARRRLWPALRWVSERRRVIAFFNALVLKAIARSAGQTPPPTAAPAPAGGARLLKLLVDGDRAVLPALSVLLPQTDLSDLDPPGQAAALRELIDREWWAGTQALEGMPPIRLRLFRLGPEEHLLTVALDHRISDGESAPIFVRDLARCYAALRDGRDPGLPPLARQFDHYRAWVARTMQARIVADLPAWAELYRGVEPRSVLPLPFYRPTPPARDYVRQQVVRDEPLGPAIVAGLRRVAEAHRATLYITMLAALVAAVHRHVGVDHVPVHISMSNRHRPEYRDAVGGFAQLGQVVGDCSGSPRFSELLARVRQWTLFVLERQEQFAYEVIPLLRQHLGLPPEIFSPFEPRVGVFFDMRAHRPTPQEIAGLELDEIQIVDPHAPPDLYFLAIEEAGGLRVTLNYSADRYEGQAVDRLFEEYLRLLQAVAAGEDLEVAELVEGSSLVDA